MYLMTGAPGSGKSGALAAFLQLNSEFLTFDIDWLAVTASGLAGHDVIFDESTSLPYRLLWFDILRCVCRNHRKPIPFSPLDPRKTADIGYLVGHAAFNW
jgi:hypothetical protein